MPAVEPREASEELEGAAALSAPNGPTTGAARRSAAAMELAPEVAAAGGTRTLRMILEGVAEEDAPTATVTLKGVDERPSWPAEIRDSWPCQGLTSEFDLDPFFANVAERDGDLRLDQLNVNVDHPRHFSETIRVPPSDNVEQANGQAVYEVRVRFAEVVYWPEFSLAVRDAETREHLEGVELRCIVTAIIGITQKPGASYPYTVIGDGLKSPIALSGGRRSNEPEDHAAGVALVPTEGEVRQPAAFTQTEENARGAVVFAWAPGFALGRFVVDVSRDAERELLLVPSAELGVRLTNVQLGGDAALEKAATLFVTRAESDGDA